MKYECNRCEREFDSKFNLNRHLSKINKCEIRRKECTKCGEKILNMKYKEHKDNCNGYEKKIRKIQEMFEEYKKEQEEKINKLEKRIKKLESTKNSDMNTTIKQSNGKIEEINITKNIYNNTIIIPFNDMMTEGINRNKVDLKKLKKLIEKMSNEISNENLIKLIVLMKFDENNLESINLIANKEGFKAYESKKNRRKWVDKSNTKEIAGDLIMSILNAYDDCVEKILDKYEEKEEREEMERKCNKVRNIIRKIQDNKDSSVLIKKNMGHATKENEKIVEKVIKITKMQKDIENEENE
jgi:hypothetical protein